MTITAAPYAAWRAAQARARELVDADRDREAVELLMRAGGIDAYEARRDVADMQEVRRRRRRAERSAA